MAGTGRAAVKVAFLGGAGDFVASGGALHIAASGSERLENRVESLYGGRFAADHLAIAAFEAPDAAAGADIAIVDALGREFFRPANVVNVIGISAINDNVVLFKFADQIVKRGIHNGCRNHEPNRPRLLELLDEIIERSRACCAFTFQLL